MSKKENTEKYRETRKKYYYENRERILLERKAKREENGGLYGQYIKDYSKRYREKNSEKVKAYQKQYRDLKRKEKKL